MCFTDDPKDLSRLLFCKKDADNVQPHVGPIQLTTTVATGRGLVAARDIAAGECLFVTPPTLDATVEDIRNMHQSSSSESLEVIAEGVLLQTMKDALRSDGNRFAAASFLALVGSSASDVTCLSMDRLLGKEATTVAESINDADLLQIIRRNAFGPDFITYNVIQKRWKDDPTYTPHRILGLYPLAAMINHSCCPNALRVFCAGNVMVVHASEAIAKGSEILWSYLPPTQPFSVRQAVLRQQHGFACDCRRCVGETTVWASFSAQLEAFARLSQPTAVEDVAHEARSLAVQSLEQEILADASLNNQVRSFLRVGFMNLYIQYLNGALQEESAETLLNICTQLHFSFCTCDNASTEHLSVSNSMYIYIRCVCVVVWCFCCASLIARTRFCTFATSSWDDCTR
jgi:hypothetical protein